MTSSAILTIDDLTKSFGPDTNPAVDHAQFSLQRGDILTLLGPSGCGKTTLLRLIAGFETPDSGTITLNGRTVAGQGQWLPPEKRDVGMVFQDYALFPHLTIKQNIAFGLHHRYGQNSKKSPNFLQLLGKKQVNTGNSSGDLPLSAGYDKIPYDKKTQEHLIQEVMHLVGLEGLEKRYPHELSGGQQQRVALARALAPKPALILLDEPLSNLDVQIRLRLRHELQVILKKAAVSAIFVTHDQEEALAISDYVVVMHQGKIEQIGTPQEVYSHPQSRFVAEFVTQANFLPARWDGDVLETEVGCFALGKRSRTMTPCENLELMIRQEDLQVYPAAASPVVIRGRSFLGRELLYNLRMPSGRELTLRTSNNAPLAIGTPVKVALNRHTLRAFPAK
jgi:iron(III) transport system ATP-binding protein